MFIYNITFHIEDDIHEQALSFLKMEYISSALAGGMLFNPRLCRIYSEHLEEGKSYSIQFYVKNTEILNDWIESVGTVLNGKLVTLFGNKLLGFTTYMKELDIEL